MKSLLIAVTLVAVLFVVVVSVASADGGVPFYVCRSGFSQAFLCKYKNVHGDTNTTWHGVAITAGLMANPVSGVWVLEYR